MERLSAAALRLLDSMEVGVVTAADVKVCRRTARQLINRRLLSSSPLARILRLREQTAAFGFAPRPLTGLVWDARLWTLSRRGRAAYDHARRLRSVGGV
jgi:hypothetical protein